MPTGVQEVSGQWLQAFLSDERYWPAQPTKLADTGLATTEIEALLIKQLSVLGTASGRMIADRICLPFNLLEEILASLRTKQIIVHSGAAPLNDFHYMLTERGAKQAQIYKAACAYVGPAPVPLRDYVISVEAQCISTESPTEQALQAACAEITVDPVLFEMIGPAVNSGVGMFLYGSAGNGKTTLARALTLCFGQDIWIPRCLTDDGHIIKLFDSACHIVARDPKADGVWKQTHDQRWVRIKRPTVMVGGELTLDNLELRHDPVANISEAPLQLKSNCGSLLIDDFGRQRVEASELLNRWIIPLEERHDYLTLCTGKKIQVPFEQLIMFSTNLEPSELVDEAFLRRIPYKIELKDPEESEFYDLFRLYAKRYGCVYNESAVRELLEKHYHPYRRALRRCHPRDLLRGVKSYCRYKSLPFELRTEYLNKVVRSYFAFVFRTSDDPDPNAPLAEATSKEVGAAS